MTTLPPVALSPAPRCPLPAAAEAEALPDLDLDFDLALDDDAEWRLFLAQGLRVDAASLGATGRWRQAPVLLGY